MQHITSGNICISSDSMFQRFEIQVSGCLNDFGLECFIRRNILVEDPFFFYMINSCIRCIPAELPLGMFGIGPGFSGGMKGMLEIVLDWNEWRRHWSLAPPAFDELLQRWECPQWTLG